MKLSDIFLAFSIGAIALSVIAVIVWVVVLMVKEGNWKLALGLVAAEVVMLCLFAGASLQRIGR